MNVGQVVFWGAVVFIVVVTAVAAWKFLVVRTYGISALIRRMPSSSTFDWRHGLMSYDGDELKFYKLRSLFPQPDWTINRTYTTFDGYRQVDDEDLEIIPDEYVVVAITHRDQEFEMAMEQHAAKALISWVESAPSTRLERMNHRDLLMKAKRRKR